jgi:hypothetical protein
MAPRAAALPTADHRCRCAATLAGQHFAADLVEAAVRTGRRNEGHPGGRIDQLEQLIC